MSTKSVPSTAQSNDEDDEILDETLDCLVTIILFLLKST